MSRLGMLLTSMLSFSAMAHAQVATEVPPAVAGAKPVAAQAVQVHGAALQGSLEGDAADRDVLIFLPPSYAHEPNRRYPVLYALHGYSIGAQQWTAEIHAPQTIEGAFALGAREMIVVLPDSKTVHDGSMYSNSVTTGNFEDFIALDLVRYVDTHYRTLRGRESRGLAGHSMGGYGTLRIGMKHADVFGVLYSMSPCCLSVHEFTAEDLKSEAALEEVKSPEQSAGLPFILRAQLASAAAWSPNPKRPPLYLDLPIKDGAWQQDVLQRWAANAPLAMIDQYIVSLRRYRGIAIDVGDADSLRDNGARLHQVLDSYAIPHSFTLYPGTHTSAVADRFQNSVIPFMSKHLSFQSHRR